MREMIYKDMKGFEILDENTYKNFDYLIVSCGSYPCAYVEIPENNKIYCENIPEDFVEVHGGITFSDFRKFKDCEKAHWYIGWDYAHYGDFVGNEINYINEQKFMEKKWTTTEILIEVKSVIDQLVELESK